MSDEEMITHMQNRRKQWGRKCLLIIPLVILAIFAVGAIVMQLWNCIIPTLFPTVGLLTSWHAIGLLILRKLLFSSFKGGHRGGWAGRRRMQQAWKEKWMHMSDEEKAKFKDEWKNRCGGRC